MAHSVGSELQSKFRRFVFDVYDQGGIILYSLIDEDTYEARVKWPH